MNHETWHTPPSSLRGVKILEMSLLEVVRNFYFGRRVILLGRLLKRFAPFSYLNHPFILSLNVKVYIKFIVFLKVSLCFLFVESHVGWEVCALASHLHVFCFHSEGGVKRLRTEGLKNFRTGGEGVTNLEGVIFAGGISTPLHTMMR